jgi:hypothetical protein
MKRSTPEIRSKIDREIAITLIHARDEGIAPSSAKLSAPPDYSPPARRLKR